MDEVEEAITREIEGPGRLLGYRAMQKKLSQVHNLRAPRDLVHAVMYNVDPDALEERAPCFKKKKRRKAISLLEERIGSIPLMDMTS